MTNKTLPTKLKKEPLVDAVFELRFSAKVPTLNILPGVIFVKSQDKEKWKIEHLPLAQVPDAIRQADPNLRNQPLIKIDWGEFFILVGDNSLGVGCYIPYPGWKKFSAVILSIIQYLDEANIVDKIERYALKYTDLIEGTSLGEQISKINLKLNLGEHTLLKESFSIRVEVPQNDLTHIIQIAAPASGQMRDGTPKTGILVDVDTICSVDGGLPQFIGKASEALNFLHAENKRIFFECLRPETIDFLEPVYE